MNDEIKTTTVKVKSLNKKNREQKIFYWLMLAFPLLQLLLFYFVVNFRSILFTFQKYDTTTSTYFGFTFKNIIDVFKNIGSERVLILSARNSLILYGCGLVFGTGLGLMFSFYIYKKYFAAEFFRVLLFLPQIISAVVLSIIYMYLVEEALPMILEAVFQKDISIKLNKGGFPYILFFTLWIGFGTSVLMYTSSMSGISESIVESASLDGVTPLKEFWYITLPMVYPTIVTFLTVGLAGIFTNQMNLVSFHGTVQSVEYEQYTFGYYLFREVQAGGKGNFPYLSAFGLIITIVIAPISILAKHYLEKFGPSEN